MYRYVKRGFDILISFFGLCFLAVPMLVVAIIIKLDSKGPAFFRQTRTGKDGKPFVMYKFRTMVSTEIMFDINNPVIESNTDNLTRVGGFLRRIKIDELPQLINVLKGEMSIIGPRPFLPIYLDEYEDWEFFRLKCKPGLTGLSQINGNGYLPTAQRSYYDIRYMQNLSLVNDIKILFKTVAILVLGEKKFYKEVDENEIISLKNTIYSSKYSPEEYKQVVLDNHNKNN